LLKKSPTWVKSACYLDLFYESVFGVLCSKQFSHAPKCILNKFLLSQILGLCSLTTAFSLAY